MHTILRIGYVCNKQPTGIKVVENIQVYPQMILYEDIKLSIEF